MEIDKNTTALSVAQVCDLWHCSRQYVHQLVNAGKLDAEKVAPNYTLIPLNEKNKKFLHID